MLPQLRLLVKDEPYALQKRVLTYFSTAALTSIVLAPADKLEKLIFDVSEAFPELLEYYCPALLLESVDLVSLPDSEGLPSGQKRLEYWVQEAIVQLEGIKKSRPFRYVESLIEFLRSDVAPNKKRRMLQRLSAARQGRYKLSVKEKAMFPGWVKNFWTCFDFEQVSAAFGLSLCEYLELAICPYCAVEEIGIYKAVSSRPDLDHFYPRSRFPYLAVSLYNLIPSGVVCNQKSKKNHPMLMHAHPHVQSMDDEALFLFDYLDNGSSILSLNIRLRSQSSPCKNNNIERFRLARIYEQSATLSAWFSSVFELKGVLAQLGMEFSDDDVKKLPFLKNELTKTSNLVVAQQFKVEAVNRIFDTSFQTLQQDV
ncbi:HNH endonuclease domain-containing protein [Pseudomonas sp. RIT623]|uniref:HNH endonuclease domain-containing protein n=1 Tax=Pseudomonas sp. RIT623 TaxID=2559075 RepID=UPI00106F5A68|nr:HNH endonuclease domain-containing protein [Pseudomonas sp. RIT623]TFF41656.1 hypothetical protein E3U47_07855 [Pseudomonas sp. RIT623]